MQTVSAPPCRELRPFIRAFAQRRMDAGELPIVESCPTQLEQLMEFQLAGRLQVKYENRETIIVPDVFIHGANTEPAKLWIPEKHEGFAVFFEPTGLSHLLGVPICELTDQVHHAPSVLGLAIHFLYEQIGEAVCFRQRVNIAERFFIRYLGRVARRDAMGLAAAHLVYSHGTVGTSDIARRLGLSIRQFERRFVGNIGVTPKRWARMVRFQSALDTKIAMPKRSWLEIAHDLGYHDQMHLIHDFKKLAGYSPSQLLTALGDMRPEAVARAVNGSAEDESTIRAA